MKTLVLVIALLATCSGICVAVSATVELHGGQNYVSCPLQATHSAPLKVFKGIDIDGRLKKWDDRLQCYVTYNAKDPSKFGACMAGEGYILDNYKNVPQFSYDGSPDGMPEAGVMTEVYISLLAPLSVNTGGWHLIGCPFNHPISVKSQSNSNNKILFTNGAATETWEEAVKAGWVDKNMETYNAATKAMETISPVGDDYLRPGRAYWIHTKIDNLAMMISP